MRARWIPAGLAAMLVLATIPAAQAPAAAGSPDVGRRRSAAERGCDEHLRRGHQAGQPTIGGGRTVTIQWSAGPRENRDRPPTFALEPIDFAENAVGGDVCQLREQTFRTEVLPSAVTVVDGETLVVCGRLDGSRTAIELWSFAWPEPMPGPTTDVTTGLTSVPVVLPDPRAVTRVPDTDVGPRLVCNVTGLRRAGLPCEKLLVQLDDDPRELYALHLATGALELIASAHAATGLLGLLPTLGAFDHIDYGDHARDGYLYAFGRSSPGCGALPPSWGTVRHPVLVDADRDGVLDWAVDIDQRDRETLGWRELTSYEDWWRP